jgi:hypothetical protein
MTPTELAKCGVVFKDDMFRSEYKEWLAAGGDKLFMQYVEEEDSALIADKGQTETEGMG